MSTALTVDIDSNSTLTRQVEHPTYSDLARELVELEQQFSSPVWSDMIEEARWLEANWGTPALMPYRGTHVAVLNGTIVGHGDNSLQLQFDIARKINVHPQRFLVEYIPPSVFE